MINHRNVMTRMLAKYPLAMLSEGYKKAWDLSVLRYLDLDDATLELCDTKQKAEENLRKARALDNSKREKKKSKGGGLINQDANLFRTLKEVSISPQEEEHYNRLIELSISPTIGLDIDICRWMDTCVYIYR